MPRLGLALSGGGFRATLYHLGVVRFLRDAGILHQVTDIASVSGGSILAAHLVLNWDRYTGDDERFAEAAEEVVQFVQFDVRNHIVRRLPLQTPFRYLAKLALRNARGLTANAILEHYYRTHLYGDRCLYELPEDPALHILTTNVSNGGLSVFNRTGLHIQQRGRRGQTTFVHVEGQMTSIPRVVGASSAFPGFFPPVAITAADLGVRDGQFPTEWFTDGGVYDNLGIRAFAWLKRQQVDFDQIFVSDAGKPFQVLSDRSLGFIGQSVRASDILWDRVWQLEKEAFARERGFLFVPITERVELDEDPTALHPVVQAEVQSIRTDLDRFSPIEINALVKHGYEVARKICRQSGDVTNGRTADLEPWSPIPEDVINVDPPNAPSTRHPAGAPRQPANPTRHARRLRKSGRRRVWSTLLDFRDWPTYIYVIAALLLLFVPVQIYRLYRHSQLQATVIDAIASGDPDIRRLLELIDSDPLENWQGEPMGVKPEPSLPTYDGIEVLNHSRIIDLRSWNPDQSSDGSFGVVYLHERMDLVFQDTYEGDRRVTLQYPILAKGVEIRQPATRIRAVVSKVAKPVEKFGELRTMYELDYDLSQVPLGESTTLEVEFRVRVPWETARATFAPRVKTDLVSVWMLFPAKHPYQSYSLVRYPEDRSETPQSMNARYTIDHPFGSLIGWSVVDPQIGTTYECRWTTD